MKGKVIIVGVSGGIAAYKAASLCSALTKAGAIVHVIMTESATKFVAPLTFQSLVRNPVVTDIFEEPDAAEISHIAIADKADLFIVVPATANIIAKIAHGIADDMLTTTLLVTRAPIWVAPAMNVNMYQNPVVQQNLSALQERGYQMIEPGTGPLACGWTGKGRLAEPEEIFSMVQQFFQSKQDLAGKTVLVTAGGTRERIDPVRYLTNDSSGKMGFAIAEAARDRGASVILIHTPTCLSAPNGVSLVQVESALEMHDAVMSRWPQADLFVATAAVADYRPESRSPIKIKKAEDRMVLELVKNPDISQEAGRTKREHQRVIAFAAETNNLEANAQAKLIKKNADMIVANDVTATGAGFGTDTNIVTLITADKPPQRLPLQSKRQVAEAILDRWVEWMGWMEG